MLGLTSMHPTAGLVLGVLLMLIFKGDSRGQTQALFTLCSKHFRDQTIFPPHPLSSGQKKGKLSSPGAVSQREKTGVDGIPKYAGVLAQV